MTIREFLASCGEPTTTLPAELLDRVLPPDAVTAQSVRFKHKAIDVTPRCVFYGCAFEHATLNGSGGVFVRCSFADCGGHVDGAELHLCDEQRSAVFA